MGGFIDRLRSGVLVAEGGMGTMLQQRGVEVPGAQANLQAPEVVESVHRLYREAGATCAITNTFGPCTSLDPAELELAAQSVAAAVRLARAGNPGAVVLGDMGPSGLVLEPLGEVPFERSFEVYRRHLSLLVEAGVDALILETFIDLADMRCAILAAKSVCDLPVIASFTFNTKLRMPLSSTTPEAAAVVAQALGASVVGTNCGFGPDLAQEVLEGMASVCNLPLEVQPNAGIPTLDEQGNAVYPGTPQQMAQHVPAYLGLGAAIVGSCCGSDPTFTQAIAAAVDGAASVLRDSQPAPAMVASIEKAMPLPQGAVDEWDDVLEFDCSDGPFDKWDILDEVSACPLVLVPDDGCEVLEQALRLYPGRAVVHGNGDPQAARLASWYGAVLA